MKVWLELLTSQGVFDNCWWWWLISKDTWRKTSRVVVYGWKTIPVKRDDCLRIIRLADLSPCPCWSEKALKSIQKINANCKSNIFLQIRKSKVCLIRLTVSTRQNEPYDIRSNHSIYPGKPQNLELSHWKYKSEEPFSYFQMIPESFQWFSSFCGRSESYDRPRHFTTEFQRFPSQFSLK